MSTKLVWLNCVGSAKRGTYVSSYSVQISEEIRAYLEQSFELVLPTEGQLAELQACLQGQEATKSIIDEVCNDPPFHVDSRGRSLTFVCADGACTPSLDLGTLCRYFDLVADLDELDKNNQKISVPFSMKTVEDALRGINGEGCAPPLTTEMFELIRFLRVRDSAYFLRFSIELNREAKDLIPYIGSGMSEASKRHNSDLARYIQDEHNWPVYGYAWRTSVRSFCNLARSTFPSLCLLKMYESSEAFVGAVSIAEVHLSHFLFLTTFDESYPRQPENLDVLMEELCRYLARLLRDGDVVPLNKDLIEHLHKFLKGQLPKNRYPFQADPETVALRSLAMGIPYPSEFENAGLRSLAAGLSWASTRN